MRRTALAASLLSTFLLSASLAAALATSLPALAEPVRADPAPGPAYGPELEGFAYPFPVERFRFTSQRQPLQMGYLDVRPETPNGRTAVLLHGKNFCAATWESQIRALVAAGYRVVAPDQIGFCKSSKPAAYQFTFRQLAENTHALLAELGVGKPILVGHSTGGMLAMHYALLYPREVGQLVLANPIGLEDWAAKGVPPTSIQRWYERDLKTTAASIRAYETATYYAGQWEPRYEPWVGMLAGLYAGPGREQVAWDSALLYDMIVTEPVVYRLPQIAVPTLLLIGQKDNTAIGKDLAPPEVRGALGDYPELGKAAARAIPGARLVEFPDLGHAPQMSDPDGFNRALIEGIAGR